ncbi:hypothetical protein [Alienimonas chondri]|uniref:TIGR04255 family protein n=1 Tax=Alienimonas chondri TaxID=2681879 RepID=A0ABX1VK06_9PLAN|nr:hypothetical protein [Alienimonas chondri]NNJ27756.1 hypothetical protein [Alienimonas chondri]
MTFQNGPSFEKPPITERLLTVQFEELSRFGLIHYGLWFQTVMEDLRLKDLRLDEHRDFARLPRIVETFPFRASPDFPAEYLLDPRRRLAARSDDQVWQMQIQPDRLSLFWQEPAEGRDFSAYPRFNELLSKFMALWECFVAFCQRHEIDEPAPNLAEVTYGNHLPAPAGVSAGEDFTAVFGVPLLGPENQAGSVAAWTVNRVFDFSNERVRVYAEAAAAYSDGPTRPATGTVLQLIGRARIADEETPAGRLGAAHDHVVKGFVELTDPSIRRSRWKQIS